MRTNTFIGNQQNQGVNNTNEHIQGRMLTQLPLLTNSSVTTKNDATGQVTLSPYKATAQSGTNSVPAAAVTQPPVMPCQVTNKASENNAPSWPLNFPPINTESGEKKTD